MMFVAPRLSLGCLCRYPSHPLPSVVSRLGLRKSNVLLRSQLHFFHSFSRTSTTLTSFYYYNKELSMSRRRQHSTHENGHPETKKETGKHSGHENDHDHEHSHSFFSGHSHAGEYNYGAEKIMAAWEGSGDKGSSITILGLLSNVVLTGIKGAAGWYMHSASLLADAGHSLSDLLGDFVTLFCWKLSRKPPSERYPYGFAKFETLGTTTVSLLLIGGALGIGFHSYHILLAALSETAATLPAGPIQSILTNVTSAVPDVPQVLSHHSHVEAVDPNAAWFAAISVLVKEWLYRVTKAVADEENSPVLLANAIHHRSDAYSSFVALFAILGSWIFPKLPLDPIGGLLVSFVILQQGIGLLAGAWGDLTDAGVSAKTRQSLKRTLEPLVASSSSPSPSSTNSISSISEPTILAVSGLRARRAGSLIFVDLTAEVPSNLTVHELVFLEEMILQTLKEARKEVKEVHVRFKPVEY
ncbi:mitochondrial iron ion transporter [Lentinula aciculospora]|uniref:Mitochondrial iron ion transporter n=1 Tax=Lentinula aciculospora TaxID=153920 RepID=A0A9W9DRT1_9AGAR|nr:mitochondrial iron ion transporter [Lentinula aciculospora]